MSPPPPASGPAESAAGSRTSRIMVAASRLVLEHGYGATSMDAVARAAGVSKATLYAHFTSKADLFAAIVASECARVVPALAGPDIDALPVTEALERMGRNFLDLVLSANALGVFRVVVAETSRFPELGRAFYRSGPERTLAMLSDYLERADRRGLLAVPDPLAAAELLWGMIRSHFHLRCLLGVDSEAPDAAERDLHVRRAVSLFVRGHGMRES